MQNAAEKIMDAAEAESSEREWLVNRVAPVVRDIKAGKRKGSPLSEAYERGLKVLAQTHNENDHIQA